MYSSNRQEEYPMKNLISKLVKGREGTSIIIVAISFTVLTGFAALAIDIGANSLHKARLQSAVDAAALAGAQELIANEWNVDNTVREYLNKNTSDLKEIHIHISDNKHNVNVKVVKNEPTYLARIFGKDNYDINVEAEAQFDNIYTLKGVKPLAIVQSDFVYGMEYTLKEGGGDGTNGNYGAIALGGTGSSTYTENLINGYGYDISVDDMIETETGNMSGPTLFSIHTLINRCNHSPRCTFDNYNVNCPRIIYIPVVNTLNVNGRSYVQVLGFATFFIEDVIDNEGKTEINGRFITYKMQGETSSQINDYGTYGIKLVK